jgi:hypothetical protein
MLEISDKEKRKKDQTHLNLVSVEGDGGFRGDGSLHQIHEG